MATRHPFAANDPGFFTAPGGSPGALASPVRTA
jgi:hypothetical protein